ncbi:MAG: D-inositol-3-phosphate glycosyltransferase [Myxococcota bacterium]|nr:D-inositol-3-phosphate glycosyltransferase [Myxococcota bacterium]
MANIHLLTKPLGPPWNDGTRVFTRNLLEHLPPLEGHQVTVPVAEQSGWSWPGIRAGVVRVPQTGGRYAERAMTLLDVARRLGPRDLVHHIFTPNPAASVAAMLLGRVRPSRTLQTIPSQPSTWVGAGKMCFAQVNVVMSEFAREKLSEQGVKDVRVIRPGVDTEVFSASEEKRTAARRAFGLENSFVYLYPGDYEFSGAHQWVIDAFADVHRELPRTRLVMACRTKTPDAKATEDGMKQRSRSMGCAGDVLFLNHVDDFHGLLQACDLVVFPAASLYGKMDIPLTLLEAMSMNKPVLISSEPPLSELYMDDIGDLIPPGDVKHLTRSMHWYATDALRYRRASSNARALVRSFFDAPDIANQYADLYRELLG